MRRAQRGEFDLRDRCRAAEAKEIYQNWVDVYGADERHWNTALREMVAESIERANALDDVCQAALAEVAEHGSVVLGCQHQKWALLAPDPEDAARFRVTWFDTRGFIGHSVVSTPEQGVACAFETHRVHVAPRSTLDEVAALPSFLEGVQALEAARAAWEAGSGPGR